MLVDSLRLFGSRSFELDHIVNITEMATGEGVKELNVEVIIDAISISYVYCDDGIESTIEVGNFNKFLLKLLHSYKLKEIDDDCEEELKHSDESISTTRELALQTSNECINLVKCLKGINRMISTGGTYVQDDFCRLNNEAQLVQCLVATPGRALDFITRNQLRTKQMFMYYVLDEADKLMSNDFKSIIMDISHLEKDIPMILFSAIYPESLKTFIDKYMQNSQEINLLNELTSKVGSGSGIVQLRGTPGTEKNSRNSCSRWFGKCRRPNVKMMKGRFEYMRDGRSWRIVPIDTVESLTAMRQVVVFGNELSDIVGFVNSLLVQLYRIKIYSNTVEMCPDGPDDVDSAKMWHPFSVNGGRIRSVTCSYLRSAIMVADLHRTLVYGRLMIIDRGKCSDCVAIHQPMEERWFPGAAMMSYCARMTLQFDERPNVVIIGDSAGNMDLSTVERCDSISGKECNMSARVKVRFTFLICWPLDAIRAGVAARSIHAATLLLKQVVFIKMQRKRETNCY